MSRADQVMHVSCVRQVERLEQARQRMVARWKQPPACSSGRNGAPVNLFAAASAAAWPQERPTGIPEAPAQPPQPPAPAPILDKQRAAEAAAPSTNPQIHPAHGAPPAPVPGSSRGNEIIAQRAWQPASQHRRAGPMEQDAAGGLRQQSSSGGVEVVDVNVHVSPAGSESSLDSWNDQAVALAEHGSNRLKRKAPTQLINDHDGPSSLFEQRSQSQMRPNADDEGDKAQGTPDVQEMPGPLTSLSQLAELRDEDYPASIRMHGSIVGMVSIARLHLLFCR